MKPTDLPHGTLGSHTQGAPPMANHLRFRGILLGSRRLLSRRSWLGCTSTTREGGTTTLQLTSAGSNLISCTS